MEKVTPLALEVTLAVQQELQMRHDEADALRKQQVERARYEADLARARFIQVDPHNRLVADTLGADWNDKLRAVIEAQELYERHRRQDGALVNDSTRSQVLELATDFPRLWKNAHTSHRDRERIVRLLIEDITLIHDGEITAHVRFQGGSVETLHLPRPSNSWELRQTSPQVIEAIDCLLNEYTEGQVANQFNEQGLRSGMGSTFTGRLIGQIRRAHRISVNLYLDAQQSTKAHGVTLTQTTGRLSQNESQLGSASPIASLNRDSQTAPRIRHCLGLEGTGKSAIPGRAREPAKEWTIVILLRKDWLYGGRHFAG